MNTNEHLLGALRAESLSHLFMVPGGLIGGFYPALANTPGLSPIVATHEAGAAYMADGYARALGAEAATVTQPGELRSAFETVLGARGPYLLDLRCDKAFTTPVTPFDKAKKEWHDDV